MNFEEKCTKLNNFFYSFITRKKFDKKFKI